MITLFLLHPQHATPIQSWTFADESIIRIGRATDNHVVLYSAVVSRKHVELRCTNDTWKLVNLGANGTYLHDQRISQIQVDDGLIFRLAQSGPQIQIRLGVVSLQEEMTSTPEQSPSSQMKSSKATIITHPTTIIEDVD